MGTLDAWQSVRAAVASIDISYFFGTVLAVQFGDFLTTYFGIYELGLVEGNPLMETILSHNGILGLIAVKFCWFGLAIAGSLLVGDSRRVLKYCFLVYLLIGVPALAVNVAIVALFLL